ncbi:MAG: SRPBCC family protein [Actinomycetota bacterium]
MTRVRFAVEVEAASARAWEVVSDPRNLPHWDKHIVRVEGVDGGLAEGVRYTTVMSFLSVQANVHCRVRSWDPPFLASIELEGLLEGTVDTTLTSLEGGERCRLEHDVDFRFRGGPLGAFAARSVRLVGGAQLALRHGTLAQKREIESRAR